MKLTLTDPTSLQNQSSFLSQIASNNAAIKAAVENTLSRDGTSPNTMFAALDMNSNQILNLTAATQATSPIRKAEFDNLVAFVNNIIINANTAILAVANVWPLTQTFTSAPVFGNPSGTRTALGLGTLATQSGTFSGTFSGTHSGASSGTNTGDQTIALTGDVTGTGTGTFAATLATAQPAVHTWALAQTFTVSPVFTDQPGTRTALGLGTLATQSGTFTGTHSGSSSGTNTGDQTITLTGDVTGTGTGTFAASIGATKVTSAMLNADVFSTAHSWSGVQTLTSPVLITPALGTPASGVATNLTGTAAGLTAGNVTTNANMTGDVTSVGNATTIGAGRVTNTMLVGSIAFSKLIGTDITAVGTLTGGATGVGFTIALGSSTVTGTLAGARLPAFTGGDVTASAGSVALAIGAAKVTNAMLNSDVFSTAHSWGGIQTFTTPVIGDATGTSINVTGSGTFGGAVLAGASSAITGSLQVVGATGYQLYLRNVSGINRIDSYNNPITATVPLNIDALNYTFQVADVTKLTLDATALTLTGNLGVSGTGLFGAGSANNVALNGAATTVPIGIGATGTDTNIGVVWYTKGTGNHYFATGGGGGTTRLFISGAGGVSVGNTTDPGATNLSVTGTGAFGSTLTTGGAIYIPNAVPGTTTYGLYNNAGTLTWNGNVLATGSSVSGTTGKLSKFTASNALGDSILSESGGTVTATASSSYAAFSTISSGTNIAYSFYGNTTSGERGRMWVDNGRAFNFSVDNGSTAYFQLNNAGTRLFDNFIATGSITSTASNSAFSVVPTTTTNAGGYAVSNGGGAAFFGEESSAGGTIFTGTTAYSTILGTSGTNLQFATNNTMRGGFSGANFTISGVYASNGGLSYGNGIATGIYGDLGNVAFRGYATGGVYIQSASGSSTYGVFSSTGLDVTGALTVSSRGQFGNAATSLGTSPMLNSVASSGGYSLALSDNINNSLYVRHPAAIGATFETDGGPISFRPDKTNVVVQITATVAKLPLMTTPGTLGNKADGTIISGGFVTPQMYGCAGDGTTDDTANLSACFNSGKPIHMVGKFKITSMITVNLTAGTNPKGLRILGAGQQLSQILIANTAAGVTVNVPYVANGNLSTANPQFLLENFCNVLTVASHGAAATLDGTTGVITSGSFTGVWNIIGSAASGSMIGVSAQLGFITNMGILSDGTGYTACGLFMKDTRFFNVNGFYMTSGIGAASGSGTTGYGIAYYSSNQGTGGNAPCNFVFEKCNIVGGYAGIVLVPSGNTTFTQPNDWEGCTITNSTIIGQANASIRACGSDGTCNGFFVTNCNLQANGCGVYMYGIGGPQITNNLTVVTSNGAIGINHLKGNNGFGNNGAIIGNTTFRGGAYTGCSAASTNGTSVAQVYNFIN